MADNVGGEEEQTVYWVVMTALRGLYGSLPHLLPHAVVLLLAFSSCLLETSGFTGGTLQRARGNGYPVRGADRARKSQKTPGTKPITSDRPLVHLDGSDQKHVLGEFSSWDRDPR